MSTPIAAKFRQSTIDAANGVDSRPVAIFLYLRISKDREGRELGVERQDGDLREWQQREHPDAVVFGPYCDNDKSASTNCDVFRADYERMFAAVRAAFASGTYSRLIVAAYTSGRLTRRPREYENQIDLARECGVWYHLLRSPSFDLNTAAGRRIGRILAANDAGEPEDISERVIATKVQRAVSGAWSGGVPPFGYRMEFDVNPATGAPIVPGRLVVDKREAKLIKDAIKAILATQNPASLRSIATRWKAAGVPTRRGGEWNARTVRGIVRNLHNAGLCVRYGEVTGPGQWPAIVKEHQVRAVRALTDDPSRTSNKGPRGDRWLGSGTYDCGKCDDGTRVRSAVGNPGRGRPSRSIYRCSALNHLSIDAPGVDDKVRGVVGSILRAHGAALLAETRSEEAAELAERVVELRVYQAELADKIASREMPLAVGAVAAQKVDAEMVEIERQRAALAVPGTVLEGVADAADPVAAFGALSVERQRAVVRVLVKVTIGAGRRGGLGGSALDADARVEIRRQTRPLVTLAA